MPPVPSKLCCKLYTEFLSLFSKRFYLLLGKLLVKLFLVYFESNENLSIIILALIPILFELEIESSAYV
jgi:hypothetical protein